MSHAQQIRMGMAASASTRTSREQKTQRLLLSCDCPFAHVSTASGGANTEHTIACGHRDNSTISCDALGQRGACPLARKMAAVDKSAFLSLRKLQFFAPATPVIEGNIGWFRIGEL